MSPFVVPTVDLAPYVARGTAAARAQVAADLDRACREVGFVQVQGHGVRPEVLAGLASAIDDFFALDEAAKLAVRVDPALNRGYTPPRSESQSLSLGVQPANRMNDFFEAFGVGRGLDDHPDVPGLEAYAGHYAANVWPEERHLTGFRDRVEAYLSEAERVATTLVTVAEDALGLAPGALQGLSDHTIGAMRLINYALPAGTDVALDGDLRGMGEHTDYGLLTVLWADRVAGLQVLGRDGSWHDVMPDEGALLVNLGDLTARLTNDQWSSTLHRVVPPVLDGRVLRRRSAAYFHDGNADARVAPLPGFVDADHPARYTEVSVDEHVRAKVEGSNLGRLNTAAGSERERVLGAAR
ncbi:2OG-Fe(II) oxygenase [Marmoricola sp. Leaf446]|uniref:isopenicillin N synthase family dioxygenase n=1 Tax=Marmoricola sp. Leaf446 TaxID=1736379 RepID=UPI0006FE2496|nr:2-oxoglutarate and iron-dependent oxygenase domain-containing protein [Marmoricola sp. Leaf446]KQT90725.1 2OG-Fe(II) oxygenase [Marmoricola sp. Leaf446]